MPAGLVESLANLGHDVDSVPREGFSGKSDAKARDAAQNAQRLLISQEYDFSDG